MPCGYRKIRGREAYGRHHGVQSIGRHVLCHVFCTEPRISNRVNPSGKDGRENSAQNARTGLLPTGTRSYPGVLVFQRFRSLVRLDHRLSAVKGIGALLVYQQRCGLG